MLWPCSGRNTCRKIVAVCIANELGYYPGGIIY